MERDIPSNEPVTRLLEAWNSGDTGAGDRLISVIHGELRRRAAAHLRRERRPRTLQPTELVNEVYIRLVDYKGRWQNRAQFFGIASEVMRRIMVDRARAHRAAKRSGHWSKVTLEGALLASWPVDVDV